MRDNGNPTYGQLMNILRERDEAKYPKGHIIPTTNNSFNPNGIYPGVWEKLPDGTILMASKSDNSSKDNKFTISEKQMPKHSHNTNSTKTSDFSGDKTLTGTFCYEAAIDSSRLGTGICTTYDNGMTKGSAIAGANWIGTSIDATHSHTTETKGNSESIDLSTILKHPITYLWIRVS